MRTSLALSFVCIAGLTGRAIAGQPYVELKNHEGVAWQGRNLAHNVSTCWLEQRDGQINKVDLTKIIGLAKLNDEFRPMTVVELRPRLMKEFGRKFDYQARGQYLVVAPSGTAKSYAELLDGVYRGYWHYFSRRNFGLQQPAFPLVAIVFKTQEEFAVYAKAEGVNPSQTLKGYYSPQTNRIVFFQQAEPEKKKVTSTLAPARIYDPLRDPYLADQARILGGWQHGYPAPFVIEKAPDRPFMAGSFWTVDSNTQDTLVHEATHQLAFNTGLHSRIADTPRWLAEGVAMMFEVQLNKDAPDGPRGGKINKERLDWFRKAKENRKHTVDQLIADDDVVFGQSALDAYAESWSFAYFLSETRAPMFSKYLKRVARRLPLEKYDEKARIEDFQAEFGIDLKRIEVEFTRFVDKLE